MIRNFSDITFTKDVKAAQEKYGSREMYEKVTSRMTEENRITPREEKLIQKINGYYMATTNADGWPYVQFRGGPTGFLKVLDDQTIGYADFRGNMQYISVGNITASLKTALILMHYPTKTRLKIWAETEILDPAEHPELAEKLIEEQYDAVVERLVIYHIKAISWNCPQHITPRYTIEEFKEILPHYPEIIDDYCSNQMKDKKEST